MAMMICGNCGRDKRSDRCEHCGETVDAPATPVETEKRNDPTDADLDAVANEEESKKATGGFFEKFPWFH